MPNPTPQRLHLKGVVKDANALGPQIAAHPLGMTDPRDGADDHHSVQAGQLTGDFIRMPFCEKFLNRPPVKGLASVYQNALTAQTIFPVCFWLVQVG
jgi:hypothetical protein